jgi:hypothetical protein
MYIIFIHIYVMNPYANAIRYDISVCMVVYPKKTYSTFVISTVEGFIQMKQQNEPHDKNFGDP